MAEVQYPIGILLFSYPFSPSQWRVHTVSMPWIRLWQVRYMEGYGTYVILVGAPLFNGLVPPSVVKACSEYDEKKAELKRSVLEKVEAYDVELM